MSQSQVQMGTHDLLLPGDPMSSQFTPAQKVLLMGHQETIRPLMSALPCTVANKTYSMVDQLLPQPQQGLNDISKVLSASNFIVAMCHKIILITILKLFPVVLDFWENHRTTKEGSTAAGSLLR